MLEVCGFNDWLIRMRYDYRCHKVIRIQPEEREKRKTDRRDAAALSKEPEEITSLAMEQVKVKAYVGGLVRSFGRKAA